MLNSLFVIDETGMVIIEKHWRGITPRDVCDEFWKEVLSYPCYEDVPTVSQFGRYYVVHVYRSGVFFAAVLERETDTLLVVEILHCIHNMLKVYMGSVVTPAHIKRSFSTVYMILDEMLYNGVPCTTEPNAMQQLIGIKTIADSLAGRSHLSSTLATGATSVTPWRKSDVKCVLFTGEELCA
jgi:AP-3 complex subunit mu